MASYPAPAARLVAEMTEAAAADPARAVAFQGAPGANSHRAALEALPHCLPLPCFSFEDALEAVKDVFPTWRGQNEQSMALAAIAFAKAKRRRQQRASKKTG